MSIQLTVMSLDFDSSGTPSTRTYNKDEITLGRFPENDVILDKPEVSGIHAKLRVIEGENGDVTSLLITDLGSSNGTLVENNSLDSQVEVVMHPNERIIIGNYLIKPTLFKGRVESVGQSEQSLSDALGLSDASGEDSQVEDLADRSFNDDVANPGPGLYFGAAGGDGGDPLDVSVGQSAQRVSLDDSPTLQMSVEELQRAALGESEQSSASVVAKFSPTPNEETPEPVFASAPVTSASTVAPTGEERSITVNLDGSDVLNLDFQATALFDVSGTISHKGAPLEGVTIEAGALGNTRTDSRGQFQFEQVEEGTHYQITASKEGYAIKSNLGSGVITSDLAVPFAATQLFAIRGLVTHKGRPLTGVSIDGGDLGFRTTGGDGSFSYEGVAEDTKFQVGVSKEGFIFSSDTDSGELSGADQSLHFAARQLFTISGQITNRGVPLSGVEVDGGALGKTTTGADGYYRFENVPEGEEYSVTASKERFRLSHQE